MDGIVVPLKALLADGDGNAGFDGVHIRRMGDGNMAEGGGRGIFPLVDLFFEAVSCSCWPQTDLFRRKRGSWSSAYDSYNGSDC